MKSEVAVAHVYKELGKSLLNVIHSPATNIAQSPNEEKAVPFGLPDTATDRMLPSTGAPR